jgi:hypothetical protein
MLSNRMTCREQPENKDTKHSWHPKHAENQYRATANRTGTFVHLGMSCLTLCCLHKNTRLIICACIRMHTNMCGEGQESVYAFGPPKAAPANARNGPESCCRV